MVIFTGHLRHNAATLTTTMDAIMKPGSGQGTPPLLPAPPHFLPFPVDRHSRVPCIVSATPSYFRLQTNRGQIFPIPNDSQRWLRVHLPVFLEQVREKTILSFRVFQLIDFSVYLRVNSSSLSVLKCTKLEEGWRRRWRRREHRNIIFLSTWRILVDFRARFVEPLSSKEARTRKNRARGGRGQALDRWELCASRGQVEMTWNDEACGVWRENKRRQQFRAIWGQWRETRAPRATRVTACHGSARPCDRPPRPRLSFSFTRNFSLPPRPFQKISRTISSMEEVRKIWGEFHRA